MRAGGAGRFVNPYTFVPLPDGQDPAAVRRAPAGHHRLGGEDGEPRYLGSVTLELTCHSPLLMRNVVRERAVARDEHGAEYALFPRRAAGGARDLVPFVPGSALAGVFRSLHETLAGGCLRVFDGDFVPGYRDKPLAAAERDRMLGLDGTGVWMMARVDGVDPDGVPTAVTVCDEVVWTPVDFLAARGVLGGAANVRTGARVSVPVVPRPDSLGRRVIESPDGVRGGQGWVVLLTHEGVRPQRRRKDGTLPVYYCATGRLEDAPRAVELSAGVWQRYVAAARGSDDMRRARGERAEASLAYVPVKFRGAVVGHRIAVRDRLFPGQVVWLFGERRAARGDAPARVQVQAVSVAQIWRHGGAGSARQRVPGAFASACCDPEELCPSCRLFGSADTTTDPDKGFGTSGERDRRARQNSYRGHVRFSDALPVGEAPVRVKRFNLAPLGAPRPGSGQMYLEHSDEQLAGRARKPAVRRRPLREWGSDFDGGRQDGYPDPRAPLGRGVRPLRGRKYYWLTGDPTARPYFRAVDEHGPDVFAALHDQQGADSNPSVGANPVEAQGGKRNALLASAEAVLPGARFACTVRFENLTRAEIGGLLAALDPGLLLAQDGAAEQARYGVAVGGGRALGFGTCTTALRDLVVESAASRYLGEDAPGFGARDAVEDFRQQAGEGLGAVWAALSHALRLGRVPDGQVWYPPAGPLPASRDGALSPASLMPSFEFWQHTEGYRGEQAESLWPLVALPRLGPGDQSMAVIEDEKQAAIGEKRLTDARAARPASPVPEDAGGAGERAGT